MIVCGPSHRLTAPTVSIAPPDSGQPVVDLVAQLAERIGSRANTTTIFGDAVSRGRVTIVPVARMSFGFGGGGGHDGKDTGEGGGGGAIVRPVGFLRLTTRPPASVPSATRAGCSRSPVSRWFCSHGLWCSWLDGVLVPKGAGLLPRRVTNSCRGHRTTTTTWPHLRGRSPLSIIRWPSEARITVRPSAAIGGRRANVGPARRPGRLTPSGAPPAHPSVMGRPHSSVRASCTLRFRTQPRPPRLRCAAAGGRPSE